jgi:hypothetical protein
MQVDFPSRDNLLRGRNNTEYLKHNRSIVHDNNSDVDELTSLPQEFPSTDAGSLTRRRVWMDKEAQERLQDSGGTCSKLFTR